MKKGLFAAALGCALFSVNSQADTIAGVYAGAQAWQGPPRGRPAAEQTSDAHHPRRLSRWRRTSPRD